MLQIEPQCKLFFDSSNVITTCIIGTFLQLQIPSLRANKLAKKRIHDLPALNMYLCL